MAFDSVALIQSHQRMAPLHDYYVPDLVELCGLAAMVRDRVSDVAIPLAPTDRTPFVTFERFMRRQRPDLVGISAFTAGARSAIQYADIAHRLGAFVVVGGYHPSARPDEMLASDSVDAVVRGQGELTLAELVESGSPVGVAGMSYRDNGHIVHNPDRAEAPALDDLPLPLREIRPERFGRRGLDYHTDTVYASRGCRGRCTFCANHLIGGGWRGRSLDGLMTELLSLTPPRRGHSKIVKFWDSSFLADTDRVAELCRRMREHNLRRHFRLVAETRAEDVIRAAPILRDMQESGFVRIGIGVESPSRETHRSLRKGLNLNHVGRAAELLRDAGIQMTKFLIVGHEQETAEDIMAYPEYALTDGTRLHNTTFFIMTPYPGTDLAADYRSKGLIESDDWDLYCNFGAVVAPAGLTSWQLQVLHAAVAIRYGAARRFLSGKPTASAIAKILEPLFVLISVGGTRGDLDPAEISQAVGAAMDRASGSFVRPRRPSRKAADRLAVVIHAGEGPGFAMASTVDGDHDRLVLDRADRLPPDPTRITLHIDARHLVSVVSRIDTRRLASNVRTLRMTPRAFRLAWLPGLGRDLFRVATAVAAMAVFHLRTTWRLRATTQAPRKSAPGDR